MNSFICPCSHARHPVMDYWVVWMSGACAEFVLAQEEGYRKNLAEVLSGQLQNEPVAVKVEPGPDEPPYVISATHDELFSLDAPLEISVTRTFEVAI